MRSDHYAVIIGISSYPNLGDPPPADLKGPAADAESLAAWLIDPGPGGLPAANVKVIRSSDFSSPPNAAPTRDEIHERAFLWLDRLAEANQQAGRPRTVGTRLYLYASGHGFSPRVRQGCLLAGNAAERQFSANVFPSAWLEWLQDAGYFREFVLWMDCCMDRQVLTQPTPPPLDPIGVGGAPGPSFIAFAASRPLKAVEKQIPEDGQKWHGIFTWNLLQGLRGAARNALGNVTGGSLADWLRQSQLGWLDDADRQSPDISKEPGIITEDDGLILVRGVKPLQFDVTLHFPAAMSGKQARLWSGAPPKPGPSFVVDAGGAKLKLQPGLYVAEVQGGGLRQGFTVTRSHEIDLNELGETPLQVDGNFSLTVNPGDATAEIRVVGRDFHVVENGIGRLSAQLPVGLYQIRIRIGRQIVEKVILLDSDWPNPARGVSQALPGLPTITSAAPLPTTHATHEYHRDAAIGGVTRIDIHSGNGARLMVMARCISPPGQAASGARPWDGVKVLDAAGDTIADMTTAGQHRANPNEDPVGVCSFELNPGNYVLRYPPGQSRPEVAQSLVLPPGGWRLEAYLLRYLEDGVAAAKPRISLLMHRINAPWGSGEDVLLEKARVALADERPILNDELAQLLFGKFENPLAGIIGGHLLLLGREKNTKPITDLKTVVTNLRAIVGPEHPDVEALSLACPDETPRRKLPVLAAPLFERSWRLLLKESQGNPQILPLSLWQQVHAALVAPPFLVWSADDSVQKGFRRALAAAAFGTSEASATMTTPAAAAAAAMPQVFEAQHTAGAAPGPFVEMGRTVAPDAVPSLRRAPRSLAKSPGAVAELLGLPMVALEALAKEFTPGA